MNRDYLIQVIVDQKEMYLNNPIVKRDFNLEPNVNYCKGKGELSWRGLYQGTDHRKD